MSLEAIEPEDLQDGTKMFDNAMLVWSHMAEQADSEGKFHGSVLSLQSTTGLTESYIRHLSYKLTKMGCIKTVVKGGRYQKSITEVYQPPTLEGWRKARGSVRTHVVDQRFEDVQEQLADLTAKVDAILVAVDQHIGNVKVAGQAAWEDKE